MKLTAVRCPMCNQKSIIREGHAFQCQNETCAADAQRIEAENTGPTKLTAKQIMEHRWKQFGAEVLTNPRTTGWVYYVEFGNRIKIGTTQNLAQRFRSLNFDRILAVEPGSPIVERERHQQFAANLVPGQREWFHATPDLYAHCTQLAQEHGDPVAIARGNS